MEYIRRCMLVVLTTLFAACSTIQAPQVLESTISGKVIETASYNQKPILVASITPKAFKQEDKADKADKADLNNIALAEKIAEHFNCSFKVAIEAIEYATLYSYQDFPKRNDILAIIAIESSFNPLAVSGGSFGVMQVLVKTHKKLISGKFNLKEQIRVGSIILRETYLKTHTKKSSVMAYNVGLGGYLSGARPAKYWSKFNNALAWLKDQDRALNLV